MTEPKDEGTNSATQYTWENITTGTSTLGGCDCGCENEDECHGKDTDCQGQEHE